MAVESFVDESRYPGTCYRACGFQALGPTAGFSRTAKDFYTYHGQPKALYFRELHPCAAALLRKSRWPKELLPYEEKVSGPCPLRARSLLSLREAFRSVPDTHRGHAFHEDQCRIRHHGAAQIMTTLRNLALSLYELNVARKKPEADEEIGEAKLGFTVWRERLKHGDAIALIRR